MTVELYLAFDEERMLSEAFAIQRNWDDMILSISKVLDSLWEIGSD